MSLALRAKRPTLRDSGMTEIKVQFTVRYNTMSLALRAKRPTLRDTVRFSNPEDEAELLDRISDIDIPENQSCTYVQDSFQVCKTEKT